MSSGLLPRVCAFGVPGQGKTHGHSGFENDFEDLVTDLPAAFVANDVLAAFYAPEVFVDAAMIASDYWVSLIGAALSAFNDAMLCFQKSIQTDDFRASSLMKIDGFWGRFQVSSGMFHIISSASLLGLLPVHTITSDGARGFAGPLEHVAAAASGSSGHSDLLVASAAKETEYMLKTAAASVAAFVDHFLNTLLLESAAFACGYFFYKNDSHCSSSSVVWEPLF